MHSYAAILEGRNAKPSKLNNGSLAQGSIREPMSLPASVDTHAPENVWPAESLENERRFGFYHARLFPFVERRVWTPLGTGKLFTAYAEHCEIILDETTQVIRVRTADVRPIQ
jgi:hypothetical protein